MIDKELLDILACPACKAGRKHKALFFSFPKGGKRVCRYVPAELAPLLRQALANGRHLERRLAQLGEAQLEAYRKNRSARAALADRSRKKA